MNVITGYGLQPNIKSLHKDLKAYICFSSCVDNLSRKKERKNAFAFNTFQHHSSFKLSHTLRYRIVSFAEAKINCTQIHHTKAKCILLVHTVVYLKFMVSESPFILISDANRMQMMNKFCYSLPFWWLSSAT